MGQPWSNRRELVGDVALAAGLLVFGLWEVLVSPVADSVVEGPTALNVIAVVLGSAPVAARRWAPLPAAAVAAFAFAGRLLVTDPLEIFAPVLAMLVLAYSVAAYASLRAASSVGALFVGAVAVASWKGTGSDASPDLLPSAILLLTMGAVGRIAHVRQSRAQSIERRALARESELDREIQAAMAAEREQIARELHDVVSHSLAVILMQAQGAQSILARDPERARESLAAIERTGRAGLVEMRRLLGLLGEAGEPARAPQPGLAGLDALVEDARTSGIDVHLSVEGQPTHLPPTLDLSAYRILQEALTNAIRHGGCCRTRVNVRYRSSCLELDVTTDRRLPRPSNDSSAGRGLLGMRTRVELLGGELHTGASGDGFRVHAVLPLQPTP